MAAERLGEAGAHRRRRSRSPMLWANRSKCGRPWSATSDGTAGELGSLGRRASRARRGTRPCRGRARPRNADRRWPCRPARPYAGPCLAIWGTRPTPRSYRGGRSAACCSRLGARCADPPTGAMALRSTLGSDRKAKRAWSIGHDLRRAADRGRRCCTGADRARRCRTRCVHSALENAAGPAVTRHCASGNHLHIG